MLTHIIRLLDYIWPYEYRALSPEQKSAVVADAFDTVRDDWHRTDCDEFECEQSLLALAKRIGDSNLAAYADVLIAGARRRMEQNAADWFGVQEGRIEAQ